MNNLQIHHIFLSALLPYLTSFIWYSPSLFGMNEKDIHPKNDAKFTKTKLIAVYLTGLLAFFITAWILSIILIFTKSDSIISSFNTTFWVWLGFIATPYYFLVIVEDTSKRKFFINSAFFLLAILMMGAVQAYFL